VLQSTELAVVGAGIVGLASAIEATRRGLAVTVVERDAQPLGASVRNFGHVYASAQGDATLELALATRDRWLELADEAGFWARPSGTLVVARLPEEVVVLEEFAARRPTLADVLGPEDARRRAPVAEDVRAALWTPLDCRVDPRTAVPTLARWLERERGVRFLWRTSVLGIEDGRLATSRGDVVADAVVLATGHDLDHLLPEVAEQAGVRRCTLQMLRVASPGDGAIEPALTTGLALLRYRGFAECPSLGKLRARLAEERPELLTADVNLIVTQLGDGDLVVGDTHAYGQAASPFADERLDTLLLDEAARLLGVPRLEVRQRWLGVYAHAREHEFLVAAPAPSIRAVAVTSGIGMTTALGLAPRVLDELFDPVPALT